MSSRSKYKVLREEKDRTVLDTFLGGVVICCFVSTWVASLSSPFILIYSVVTGTHLLTASIVLLSLAAYLPWNKGAFTRAFAGWVDTYHPRFYESFKMIVHKDSLPNSDDFIDYSAATTPKNPSPKLYGVHPHGIICLGFSAFYHSQHEDLIDKSRACFSPVLCASPFFLLWSRLTGIPGKADKRSMVSFMKRGENVILPPGGFEEATISCLSQDRVYIKKRAGFVKLCLQHGYKIVPVYCFGERLAYWNLQGFWKLRIGQMNAMGIPAVFAWGKVGLLPKRNLKMLVVAGEPLNCPKIESPTRADVELWHKKYTAALVKVFDEFKIEAYGEDAGKTAKLELW